MPSRLDRRAFLGGSLTLGIATAGSGLSSYLAAAGEPAVDAREAPSGGMRADVLVLGAGASGIPAAIAAARLGASVLLLEEDPVPGGAPVDMGVTMLCGWPRVGIFREMVHRLQTRHHLLGRPVAPEEEKRDTWFLPSSYVQVLTEMIATEKRIRPVCGAQAVAPIVDRQGPRPRVSGVVVAGPGSKRIPVRAQVTIDCTGSGAIAEAAGATALYGRDAKSAFHEPHARDVADTVVMPCTWMYVSQRFRASVERPMDFGLLNAKGVNESGYGWFGSDPAAFRRRDTGIYLHWGCSVLCEDTRDPMALARAQQEGWRKMLPDLQTLFEHGYATHLPPRIGVREGRRIVGEHVITEIDLKSGTMPADTIAVGEYYLDVWGERLTEDAKRLPPFGIPYRALIPKGVDGLLVAGKIISGTHVAMSAYRVQPIVAQIGQAAGSAAAMAARTAADLRGVPIADLQRHLRAAGIPIPG